MVMKLFLGTGSLAEYVTVPAGYGIAHVPDGLDNKDAGALGLAGTAAFDSLNALNLAEGETVLISGATGGVGALAVQLATASGARVIATARPGAETDAAPPDAWQRLVAHMLRSYATPDAPIPPMPDAPASTALYLAMVRITRTGSGSV
ncbi:hypothetical protein [Streptomyces bacillaris]|uniref:hypothetical protein n=1 Tax=Streptomyces bacillaris TaxID=68179 RepID=UPI0036F8B2F2